MTFKQDLVTARKRMATFKKKEFVLQEELKKVQAEIQRMKDLESKLCECIAMDPVVPDESN